MYNKTTISKNHLTAPSQRTLSDYVADQLRKAILAEHFKPDQKFVEQEIAEMLGISRGPVRVALKILMNEGLVVRHSHHSTFITRLTPEDFMEICTLRESLEILAIQYAIKKATNEQINSLEGIVYSMGFLAKQDYTLLEATNIDAEFHHSLCKISGHKRVLSAWESISSQIRLVLLKHKYDHPDDLRERSVSWHKRIVNCLYARDIDQASKEMHIHLAASYVWVETLLNKKSI